LRARGFPIEGLRGKPGIFTRGTDEDSRSSGKNLGLRKAVHDHVNVNVYVNVDVNVVVDVDVDVNGFFHGFARLFRVDHGEGIRQWNTRDLSFFRDFGEGILRLVGISFQDVIYIPHRENH